jgi:hypothetical protein
LPKKLKSKVNILAKMKKIGASFLLGVILLSLVPNFALAEQGIANDGRPEGQENRTFSSEDIVLRSETDIATFSDCNGKPLKDIISTLDKLSGQELNDKADELCKFNTSLFKRFGKDTAQGKNTGYILVRSKLYLDKPDELRFASITNWQTFVNLTANFLTFGLSDFLKTTPKVDYIKTKDGLGGWFEVIHPLLGYGFMLGRDDKVTCQQKNVAYPWEKEENIKFCELPIPGLSNLFTNISNSSGGDFGGNSLIEFKDKESVKANGLVHTYLNYIEAGGRLDKWGLGEVGKTQKVALWPYLYINLGVRQIKEKIIVSAASAKAVEYTSKGVEGILNKVVDWLPKLGKEKTVQEAAKVIAAQAPELTAESVTILSKSAVEAGEESFAIIKNVPGARYEVQDLARRITTKIAESAKVLGATEEQIAVLSTHAAQTVMSGAPNVDPKTVLSVGEKISEEVVKKVGVSEKIAQFASRNAAKWMKIVKFAGPFFQGIYFAFSVAEYRSGHLDYFDTNKNTIAFQVYQTEDEALANKDAPPPAGLEVESGNAKGGAGQTVGKNGNSLLGFINSVIGILLGFVQELIFTIFYYLIAPLIQAMLSIHTYTDTFAAVIYPGWEVVRNLSNILFIVAIIAIAMATLFRVESYQYKHLVVELITAALLVNFSLVIAQVILGFADTVQSQFLPNNADVIRALGRDLIVGYRSTVYNGLSFASGGFFSNTVTPFFFLALAIGSFLVFCAIAGFLVVRIVFLWVLLMLSPLAYLAGVLPSTEKYKEEWWGMFLKYAFFTPIMAFFLNLAAVISTQYKDNSVLKQITYADFGNDGLSVFVFKVASNILLLVFLFISIKVAEEFGVFGADIASKVVQGGIAAPFAGVGWLGGVGARWLQRKKQDITSPWSQEHGADHKPNPLYKKLGFAILNPVTQFKAFQKDSEKNQERAQHAAEGAALDLKRQTPFFKEPGLASEYAEAQLHYIDQLSKERPYTENEALEVKQAIKAAELAKKDDKQKANFTRMLFQLSEHAGINAFMDSYVGKDKNGKAVKFEFTPEGVNAMLQDLVRNKIVTAQMGGEIRSRLSKIGYDTKQQALYEGTNYHGDSVHPLLFESEQDSEGRWQIAGKHEYEYVINNVYEKLDSIFNDDSIQEVREIKAKIPVAGKNGATQEDVDSATAIARERIANIARKSMANHKGEIYKKYANAEVKGADHHHLENYAHWVESMEQKNSNISKAKTTAEQLTGAHWNSVVTEVNGGVELQESIVAITSDINESFYFAAGRGQIQPKVVKGITKALNNKKRFIQQQIDYLSKKAKLSGELLPSPKELEDKAEEIYIATSGFIKATESGMIGGKNYAEEQFIASKLPIPKWLGKVSK